MTRHLRPLLLAALALVATGAPALAQYANEYVPPKLTKLGKTTKPIAGSGIVEVKVQVNADGSHKFVSVIKSSNRGDNPAAVEIASTSSFATAHRGKTPMTAFITFSLKFTGKSFAGESVSSNIDVQRAEGMVRSGNYSGAKASALAYLQLHPGDTAMLQELGAAEYFLKDPVASAAAFSKVPVLLQEMKGVASHAFAAATVQTVNSNPVDALVYAHRAYALDPGANGLFALGLAQEANKQYADAAASIEKARALAFADSKTTTTSKVNIDARLMGVYVELGNDAKATEVANEIRTLDPTSTLPARFLGGQYIKLGQAATAAKNTDEALADFAKAAGLGDAKVTLVALTSSSFALLSAKTPDYDKAKSFADKALAVNPNDAAANFAQGIALFGQAMAFHRDDLKDQAKAALTKAESLAKAAND
ncbi:MAG: hypothetical protein ACYDA1_07880, partial [Vulcanimicrobiaceae bacterium]